MPPLPVNVPDAGVVVIHGTEEVWLHAGAPATEVVYVRVTIWLVATLAAPAEKLRLDGATLSIGPLTIPAAAVTVRVTGNVTAGAPDPLTVTLPVYVPVPRDASAPLDIETDMAPAVVDAESQFPPLAVADALNTKPLGWLFTVTFCAEGNAELPC